MIAVGSITAYPAPKDGISVKGDTGLTGLSIRNTEWVAGVYYRNDTSVTATDRYLDYAIIVGSGDFQDGVGTNYSIYQAKAAHNGVISSATNKPGTGTNWGTYWEKINVLKPVFTPILLASLIKASQIEVDAVIADGIFGRDLDVENAILRNLTVNRLGTTANPYAGRFANVGSGIGVFRNLDDESSIDNAIIGMGKDISIMQQTGERKPAFVVRDKQWRGTYSSSTIYYKDDRVYYNGVTYIFTKDWLETDTPSAGYLPTNVSYWQYLGSGNLGGGSYSELGSEGMFSNGSNIMGFSVTTGVTSNFSAAYLLQKRNSKSNGISAAVLGMDQTDETDGQSKSYGGYFNSAYIGRVVHNIRTVSASGAILKSDYRIHCYNTSTITLTMPTPDNSMVGQTIKFRKLGAQTVYITTSTSYKFWHISELTTLTLGKDDGFSVTWDGAYWVTEFTNQS